MRGSCTVALVLSLFMTARSAAVCGDLTFDGVCDLDDLTVLLTAYGQHWAGDLDADGDTDLSDLTILLAHFGSSSPMPVSVDELSVPPVLVAGSTFDMQFLVRNDGACWTSYYPGFEIFWSADETHSGDDFRMYGGALNLTLEAGETVPVEMPFVPVPCDTPPGAGFVIMRMDWIGYVSTSFAPAMVVSDCE